LPQRGNCQVIMSLMASRCPPMRISQKCHPLRDNCRKGGAPARRRECLPARPRQLRAGEPNVR
jgi:hypothetical protein